MAQGRAVSRAPAPFRDSRGRLMAGHPGLKRPGCISWRRRWRDALAEEIDLVGVPPAVEELGLEGLWRLILERATIGGGPDGLRAVWALAEELSRPWKGRR